MTNEIRDDFRQCMRRMASTVCVITCLHDGVRYGITATAVTSLCFEPISVLACINRSSSLLSPLLAEKQYSINLLGQQHVDVSQRFSTPQLPHERFATGNWLSNDQGIPYLKDAQATLFCEFDQAVPYATHNIVIGRVRDCQFSDVVSPLIYQNGAYVAAISLPEVVVS